MLLDYMFPCKKVYTRGQADLGDFLFIKAIKTGIKLKLLLLVMDLYYFSTYTFCEDTKNIGHKVLQQANNSGILSLSCTQRYIY